MHKLGTIGCAARPFATAQADTENSCVKSDTYGRSAAIGETNGNSKGCALQWPTLQEAAGLLSVERSVLQRRIQRGEYRWEQTQGNGGKQYRIDPLSLPETARNAWLARFVSTIDVSAAPLPPVATEPVRPGRTTPSPASRECTHEQRVIGTARLLILRAVQRLQSQLGTQNKAVYALLAQRDQGVLPAELALAMALSNDRNGFRFDVSLNDGAPIAVPLAGQAIDAFAAKVSWRTIVRWCQAYALGGADALTPRRPQPDMSVPAWAPYFLTHKARFQGPEIIAAYRAMCAALPDAIPQPSYHQVRRWFVEKYSSIDKMRGTTQGSSLSQYKFAHKRTSNGMVPMQEIHSDGWGTHFTAPHPVSGKFVKLEIWHTHDVATRYVFEPAIGLSESMMVILDSLYNTVKAMGVPAVWQTDNTGSVKNDRVEFDPTIALKARLGFEIVHNLPGNSQANGICENFNKYLDRCARELATYTGKSMDSLAAKRVHKITQKMVKAVDLDARRKLKHQAELAGTGMVFDSFEQAVDWIRKCVHAYNHRPHRALPRIVGDDGKRRHMTPAEMLKQHINAGWKPVLLDADELRDAFRPHETIKVVRGCVRVFGQRYHDPMLEHFNGELVQVAYDLDDGDRVYVKHLDGRAICEAKFYAERAYRAQSFYEYAMNKRADAALKRHKVKMAEIERQRPAETIEIQNDFVVPGLISGKRDALSAQANSLLDDVADVESNVIAPPETPQQRFKRWLDLDQIATNGGALSGADLMFYRQYQKGSEWRALHKQHEEGVGERPPANATHI